jgi:hypothetical protein
MDQMCLLKACWRLRPESRSQMCLLKACWRLRPESRSQMCLLKACWRLRPESRSQTKACLLSSSRVLSSIKYTFKVYFQRILSSSRAMYDFFVLVSDRSFASADKRCVHACEYAVCLCVCMRVGVCLCW